MSTTDIPTKPSTTTETHPLRSAFNPLPTFDVIVTSNRLRAGKMEEQEHTIHWTDGVDALWEYNDIIKSHDLGEYRSFTRVRIEFNGKVFRNRFF